MKGNLKILKVVSSAVSHVSASASSTACSAWAYQPKTPKSLRK